MAPGVVNVAGKAISHAARQAGGQTVIVGVTFVAVIHYIGETSIRDCCWDSGEGGPCAGSGGVAPCIHTGVAVEQIITMIAHIVQRDGCLGTDALLDLQVPLRILWIGYVIDDRVEVWRQASSRWSCRIEGRQISSRRERIQESGIATGNNGCCASRQPWRQDHSALWF